MTLVRPAWYLTPYILWLGLVDWLSGRVHLTHEQVGEEIKQEIKQNGHRTLRRLGIGAGLFGLLVLFVAHVFAPAVERLASGVPKEAVLPAAGLLAGLSVLAIVSLVLRAGYRILARTYARGLREWERRQALYKG